VFCHKLAEKIIMASVVMQNNRLEGITIIEAILARSELADSYHQAGEKS
jgi:hypothetical protein